jgi:hypothetical protein
VGHPHAIHNQSFDFRPKNRDKRQIDTNPLAQDDRCGDMARSVLAPHGRQYPITEKNDMRGLGKVFIASQVQG